MRLLELDPAELEFLERPITRHDALASRLTRRLALTLTARLRLPVRAHLQEDVWVGVEPGALPVATHAALRQAAAMAAVATAVAHPDWQPDTKLATLWLTRRLGGRQVIGSTSFIPQTLIQTLNAALAESWLDLAPPIPPDTLAWEIESGSIQATLALQLPRHSTDMTRWARGVIQHA